MAGKDTNFGASGVVKENVVVEHGRDPLPPAGGKKGGRGQSKSRDAFASLDGRTGHLEIAMGDVKDHVGMVEQNLQTLEDHVLEELESLKRAVGAQDELRERFTELFNSLQEQLDVVKVGMEEIRQDATMCKRAIAGGAVVTPSPTVDTPKLKEFGGKRDAKELDNYIWHMERYFEGVSITDEKTKVRTATLYLTDTATLWWRRKHCDIEKGLYTIDTWEVFKREIKKQLYPKNVAYEAKKKMKELRHKGSLDGKRALESIVSPTNNHPKRLHVKDVRQLDRAKPLCVNEAFCVNDRSVVDIARGEKSAPRKQKQVKKMRTLASLVSPTNNHPKRLHVKDFHRLVRAEPLCINEPSCVNDQRLDDVARGVVIVFELLRLIYNFFSFNVAKVMQRHRPTLNPTLPSLATREQCREARAHRLDIIRRNRQKGGKPAPRKQKQVKNGGKPAARKQKQLKNGEKLTTRKQKQVKNDEPLNLEGPNTTFQYCHANIWYQEQSVKSRKTKEPQFSIYCGEGKCRASDGRLNNMRNADEVARLIPGSDPSNPRDIIVDDRTVGLK
ncbi:hypothetical protein RJ639_011554 [Escallonia herrerae]|uniref:Retrotransposon gag domain-containing protein n=1 Tax=Escallonia herrerae TaxID=1293975 RepID=A0AA89AQC8_9ASTE|nr:hypothetical protein RJ639_011554 [Escallonia herrerae]